MVIKIHLTEYHSYRYKYMIEVENKRKKFMRNRNMKCYNIHNQIKQTIHTIMHNLVSH